MIHNIQAVRGACAIAVAAYHLNPLMSNYFNRGSASDVLAMGVDVFFVVSGFIMVYTNSIKMRSPLHFLYDRAARIVPLYYIATFLMLALYFIGFRPAGLHAFNAEDVIRSLLFLPVQRVDGVPEPILTVGWTLIFEMYFYVLFGLSLAFRSLPVSVLLLSLVFGGLMIAEQQSGPFGFAIAYYMTFLPFEFLGGALLGLWYTRSGWSARFGPALGWTLIVAGALVPALLEPAFLDAFGRIDFDSRVLLFGVPSMGIVAGALILEANGIRARHPWVMALGAASYALYLFHPLALHGSVKIFAAVADRIGLDRAAPGAAVLAATIGMAASLAAAFLVHFWLEKPIARLLHARGRPVPAAQPA